MAKNFGHFQRTFKQLSFISEDKHVIYLKYSEKETVNVSPTNFQTNEYKKWVWKENAVTETFLRKSWGKDSGIKVAEKTRSKYWYAVTWLHTVTSYVCAREK